MPSNVLEICFRIDITEVADPVPEHDEVNSPATSFEIVEELEPVPDTELLSNLRIDAVAELAPVPLDRLEIRSYSAITACVDPEPATALEIACKIETVAEDEPEPDTVELNSPANVFVIVDKEEPVPAVEELIDIDCEIVEEEDPEPVTVELIVRVVPEPELSSLLIS